MRRERESIWVHVRAYLRAGLLIVVLMPCLVLIAIGIGALIIDEDAMVSMDTVLMVGGGALGAGVVVAILFVLNRW